jgi:hypothetical protein
MNDESVFFAPAGEAVPTKYWPHEAGVSNAFTIFTGTANPALATMIAGALGVPIGSCWWNDIRTATWRCGCSNP